MYEIEYILRCPENYVFIWTLFMFCNSDADFHCLVWITAVTVTLLNFVRLFKKAHEENCKQAELDRKKAEKEAEMEKAKGVNLAKKATK